MARLCVVALAASFALYRNHIYNEGCILKLFPCDTFNLKLLPNSHNLVDFALCLFVIADWDCKGRQ